MNVADTETLMSVLTAAGFSAAAAPEGADVVLLNTCAIREGAEAKIWARLRELRAAAPRSRRAREAAPRRVVGVLGCMAERLKGRLLETDLSSPSGRTAGPLADLVAGPDAYRDLPRLIEAVRGGAVGAEAMNVQLSAEETYADVAPLRAEGSVSAFLSVMRGCNNMCAFCIVPFTRGRERSRPASSIVDEVAALAARGVKEITLLGQNVNSYADFSEAAAAPTGAETGGEPAPVYAEGFSSVYAPRRDGAVGFGELLRRVAAAAPETRIRFTSPHPKDFPDAVLAAMREHANICRQVHLPAQSGSSTCLQRMKRGYGADAYLALARRVRQALPGAALSSDFISGFCGESEEEHRATLALIAAVRYEAAFMFAYSPRDKTAAARHLADDVPPDVKQRRLAEVIDAFRAGAMAAAKAEAGRVHLVLVEGRSKRSAAHLSGRTCTNKRVAFPDVPVPADWAAPGQRGAGGALVQLLPGDYVAVAVDGSGTNVSLRGAALGRVASLQAFHAAAGGPFVDSEAAAAAAVTTTAGGSGRACCGRAAVAGQ